MLVPRAQLPFYEEAIVPQVEDPDVSLILKVSVLIKPK